MLILILAHLLDFVYPFHKGLLLKIHPVHTSYFMALRLGKPYSSKIRGVLVWLLVVSSHLIIYALAIIISGVINRLIWILVLSYVLKTSISLKLLIDIVHNVGKCFEKRDIECARYWTQQIVRRDVYKLDERHVASASIESLAESLVDGYISPLFYFIFLGPLGALFQRIVNTLDGALGYKNERYREVGWFSAFMDTLLNYVPARITALLIIILSPINKRSIRESYEIWRRDHNKTESINAGHPMSAMAGSLGVILEKPGYYRLGEDLVEEPYHILIKKAIRISLLVTMIFFIIIIIMRTLITILISL